MIHSTRVTAVFIIVCVSAAVLAGFLGSLAALMYGGFYLGPPGETEARHSTVLVRAIGLWWGAATGLIAGVVWCWAVHARIARRRADALGRVGTWLGLLAGTLSTVLLHGGLMVASQRFRPDELLVGLLFGIPSGLVLGAICGCSLAAVLRSEATPATEFRVQ